MWPKVGSWSRYELLDIGVCSGTHFYLGTGMERLLLVALVASLFGCKGTEAVAPYRSSRSGQDLLAVCKGVKTRALCGFYVMGAIDGRERSVSEQGKSAWICTDDTPEDLSRIVERWLVTRPTELHRGAQILIVQAIEDSGRNHL